MSARVMLVGPFERDNLGDLLFPLVTEQYLSGAEVVLGVPFAPSTAALLGRTVEVYGPRLRDERFDVVWSVGGQLGGVDAWRAWRMGATPQQRTQAADAGRRARRTLLREAAGGVPVALPYVPVLADYRASAGALGVVTSAGLASVRGASELHRQRLVGALRRRSAISVRDAASSALLTEHGIAHRLAPDAVHALGVLRPRERRPGADVAIVQLSHRTFARLGRDELALALASALGGRGLRLRLLAAGLAHGHDDPAELAWLRERLVALDPSLHVEVIATRRPWELVDEIAAARLVVSTSLHLRIIAAAYAVARVSLARGKVTEYARHWDPGMPAGVSLDRLTVAVRGALAHADDADHLAACAQLSVRAHATLKEVAAEVLAAVAAGDGPPRGTRLSPRRLRRARPAARG